VRANSKPAPSGMTSRLTRERVVARERGLKLAVLAAALESSTSFDGRPDHGFGQDKGLLNCLPNADDADGDASGPRLRSRRDGERRIR